MKTYTATDVKQLDKKFFAIDTDYVTCTIYRLDAQKWSMLTNYKLTISGHTRVFTTLKRAKADAISTANYEEQSAMLRKSN
jgi:hypothetical protein